MMMLMAAAAAAVWSNGRWQLYTLDDVAVEQTITLKKSVSQGAVHRLRVLGEGQLDGTGEIQLLLDGEPYWTESLKDEVRFSWSNDWYSDEAVFLYKPSSAKNGSLQLRFRFDD